MATSSRTLALRVDSSPSLGWGHFARCFQLAQKASAKGWTVYFWLGHDHPSARQRLDTAAVDFSVLASPDIVPDTCVDGVIFDAVHEESARDLDRLTKTLRGWRHQGRLLVLIDGGGEQSVRGRLPDGTFDVAVAPYAGETGGQDVLAGPTYAILGSDYAEAPRRICAEQVTNVLISCGGSDVRDLGPRALGAAAAMTNRPLWLRLVAGETPSPQLVSLADRLARTTRHRVELVPTRASLCADICWADMAIATSGLTKYELAACGTPAVLISIDDAHDRINQPFMEAGTAWSGGTPDDLDDEALTGLLRDLAKDFTARKRMAERGQLLVDGRGADRLLELMEVRTDVICSL